MPAAYLPDMKDSCVRNALTEPQIALLFRQKSLMVSEKPDVVRISTKAGFYACAVRFHPSFIVPCGG